MFAALKQKFAIKPWTQIRGAHKKVVSSKTHMQDSPGKRLGPKKYENHLVKTGQIIYRQRGTKWYPGFGCGIGKDHTIFALEPGFVKYYLDPFHPKRKFIGIAHAKEDTLPYPHFDPIVRRLGRSVLKGKWATEEFNTLPRKVEISKDSILSDLTSREENRNVKKQQFAKQLGDFLQLEESEISQAAARLVTIDGHLRGGKSLDDARFYTTYNYKFDLKLSERKGELSAEESATNLAAYIELANKIDNAIMFDSKFQLAKNMSIEEISKAKLETIEQLNTLVGDFSKPLDKKAHASALELIGKPFWTLKDQSSLKKRYLKPVLTAKNSITIQKMNVLTRRAEPFQIIKPSA